MEESISSFTTTLYRVRDAVHRWRSFTERSMFGAEKECKRNTKNKTDVRTNVQIKNNIQYSQYSIFLIFKNRWWLFQFPIVHFLLYSFYQSIPASRTYSLEGFFLYATFWDQILGDQQFLKHSNQPFWQQVVPLGFFTYSDSWLNINWRLWPVSARFYSRHMTG